jgi:hypothetical protein
MTNTSEDPQRSLVENGTNSATADDTERVSTRDEGAYTAKIDKMVAEQMPRLFAMCEEIDDGAEVVAWGLSFSDHAEVIVANESRQHHFLFPSAEYAPRELSARSKYCRLRLVWADQAQANQHNQPK